MIKMMKALQYEDLVPNKISIIIYFLMMQISFSQQEIYVR